MKTDRPFFKYLAYSLEIVIFTVLQATPKLLPEPFGSKPFLLLALALSFSAFEEFIPSAVLAAVCGAFADCSSGGTVGYFAAAFTVTVAAAVFLTEAYLNASLFTFIITSAAAVFAVLSLYFVIFRLFSGGAGVWLMYLQSYLPRMGLTLLCAVPLYFLNGFIHRSFTAKSKLL